MEEAVPLLLLTLLNTDVGEGVGEDEEELDARAVTAQEARKVCDTIKEEVWAEPIKFYQEGVEIEATVGAS